MKTEKFTIWFGMKTSIVICVSVLCISKRVCEADFPTWSTESAALNEIAPLELIGGDRRQIPFEFVGLSGEGCLKTYYEKTHRITLDLDFCERDRFRVVVDHHTEIMAGTMNTWGARRGEVLSELSKWLGIGQERTLAEVGEEEKKFVNLLVIKDYQFLFRFENYDHERLFKEAQRWFTVLSQNSRYRIQLNVVGATSFEDGDPYLVQLNGGGAVEAASLQQIFLSSWNINVPGYRHWKPEAYNDNRIGMVLLMTGHKMSSTFHGGYSTIGSLCNSNEFAVLFRPRTELSFSQQGVFLAHEIAHVLGIEDTDAFLQDSLVPTPCDSLSADYIMNNPQSDNAFIWSNCSVNWLDMYFGDQVYPNYPKKYGSKNQPRCAETLFSPSDGNGSPPFWELHPITFIGICAGCIIICCIGCRFLLRYMILEEEIKQNSQGQRRSRRPRSLSWRFRSTNNNALPTPTQSSFSQPPLLPFPEPSYASNAFSMQNVQTSPPPPASRTIHSQGNDVSPRQFQPYFVACPQCTVQFGNARKGNVLCSQCERKLNRSSKTMSLRKLETINKINEANHDLLIQTHLLLQNRQQQRAATNPVANRSLVIISHEDADPKDLTIV